MDYTDGTVKIETIDQAYEGLVKLERIDPAYNINDIAPNICKICSRICYPEELNNECVCNECCFEQHPEEITADLDIKPSFVYDGIPKENDCITTEYPPCSSREQTLHGEILITKLDLDLKSRVAAPAESDCGDQEEILADDSNLNVEHYIKQLDNSDYICTICPENKIQKFPKADNVRRHIKIIHYDYRYECTMCEHNSVSLVHLRRHLKKTHNIMEVLNIELTLPPEENRKLNYKNHIKQISAKHFICTICTESKSHQYRSVNCVRQHIKVVHYNLRYVCIECNCRYTNSQMLNRHNRNVHNKEYAKKGNGNGNTTPALENPEKGIQKVNNHYICTFCSADSSWKYSSRNTVRKHHNLIHFGYICTECNTKFMAAMDLRKHLKKKHNKKAPLKIKMTKDLKLLEKCKESNSQNIDCKKFFTKASSHYACTLCPKSKIRKYNSQASIRNHLEIKHFGCWYKCTECNIKCAYKAALKRHYKITHNNEGPSTLLRTKNYKLMEKLNILMKQTKPRVSNVQDFMNNKMSAKNSKSAVVVAVGNLEKLPIKKIANYYICTLCTEVNSTKYKSSTTVKQHIRIQHNGCRYICSDCGKNYTKSYRLRDHYAKEHNKHVSPKKLQLIKPKDFEHIDGYFICKLCPAETKVHKYKHLVDIQCHIKVVHQCFRYECTECNTKLFWNLANLKRHYKAQHNIADPLNIKLIKCEESEKISDDKDNENTEDAKYIGKICSQSVVVPAENVGQGQEKLLQYAPLSCNKIKIKEEVTTTSHCSYTYAPDFMEKPSVTIKSEVKVESSCGDSNLNIEHYIKQLDNSVYICTLCPENKIQKYSESDSLRKHIKIIHYNYRYECTECEHNSVNLIHLRRHLKKAHNIMTALQIELTLPSEENRKLSYINYIQQIAEKQFICIICTESKSHKYKSVKCVREHIKVVHYDFKYECTDCNARYKNVQMLRRHYRNKHGKECPKSPVLTRSSKLLK